MQLPAGKHLSLFWGSPREAGARRAPGSPPRLFLEFPLEMLSCCPFRQHPWHVPSSHRVGQPAPFPLSRAPPSCELTRALLESTAAEPEVQSSPLSSAPKNTLPARLLAASHPRAQVLAAAGHTRGWRIAGSGWDRVSWEPALPPRIDYREGLKFGESSLATVTVCAGC